MLGTDHPREIIMHVDTGFLQRRVRLENTCSIESIDRLTIILSDTHVKDLVDRISKDICKDRFIESCSESLFQRQKSYGSFH